MLRPIVRSLPRKLGIERPLFIDTLSGLCPRVNEHCAGKDELPDGEVLKMLQQPLGPTHGDLFVQRARLTRKVIVRGKVNDRGDMGSVGDADALEGTVDPMLRG